ncbi:MAG: helix-turn-helix domain-containing protein [Clostridiales bacterium]|nr:helix-turn-helix domain-containing protein [Clostridiales bacterium]
MNQYVTGTSIRKLRERSKLTQAALASKIGVSDKTVSKWETGKGYPDITLLEPLAETLKVSVTELISGTEIMNSNVSSNMLRSGFYVCPVCGNVIHSIGEGAFCCHGISLTPEEREAPDEEHQISVEIVEDEYFIRIRHDMTKKHYISFAAAVSSDRVQMVKFYPEGNAETRFKIAGVRRIYFYCNRHGLFCINPLKYAGR